MRHFIQKMNHSDMHENPLYHACNANESMTLTIVQRVLINMYFY